MAKYGKESHEGSTSTEKTPGWLRIYTMEKYSCCGEPYKGISREGSTSVEETPGWLRMMEKYSCCGRASARDPT